MRRAPSAVSPSTRQVSQRAGLKKTLKHGALRTRTKNSCLAASICWAWIVYIFRVRISGGLQVLHRDFAPPCQKAVDHSDQASLEFHRHVAPAGLEVRVFLDEGFGDFGHVPFQKLLEDLDALVGGVSQRQALDFVLLMNLLHDLHFDPRRLAFA